MESSTSAVNWQPRNIAKAPGALRRHSLSHVARGADGVMFFQCRQSQAGAEKFHSGLVPHAGTDSKVWREVIALGAELRELVGVLGSPVHAQAAILWDYHAWWAVELDSHPSVDITYVAAIRRVYDALWHAGITVDFVHPEADLTGYDLLFAPSLYLTTYALAVTPDPDTLAELVAVMAREAGVRPAADVPAGVEVVHRGDLLFVLNHTEQALTVAGVTVDAGAVAVVPAP